MNRHAKRISSKLVEAPKPTPALRSLTAVPSSTIVDGRKTLVQMVYWHHSTSGTISPVVVVVDMKDDSPESFIAAGETCRAHRDKLQAMTDAEFAAATNPPAQS